MYREKETIEIYNLIKSGDSTLLVGPTGIGKSAFAKKMLEPSVLKGFLGEKTISAYLSVEDLPQLTTDNFFRLYLKKLVDAVNERQLNFRVVEETELYGQISELFLLEKIRTLLKLLAGNSFRIIIVIDGLERLADAFDRSFFAALKSLRDVAPPRFSYLLLSRSKIFENEASTKAESLLKIASANVIYLKPFSRPDSETRVAEMAAEREIGLDPGQIEKVVNVGGGYPSLLKLCLQYLDKDRQASREELAETVFNDPSAQRRLSEIHDGLDDREKKFLKLWLRGGKAEDEPASKSLEKKGVVANGQIFSPLFKKYLESLEFQTESKIGLPTQPANVWIDQLTRRVYLEGVEIGNLTRQEFRLLEYLFKNPEKICDREEIIAAVWGAEAEQGISDEAIDQLVTRLRAKIEKDKSNPQHLITIRGRGFSFKS